MANALEQLKQYTTVVADTGDIKCKLYTLDWCVLAVYTLLSCTFSYWSIQAN